MTWKVLISAPYLIPFLDRFEDFFVENDIEVVVPDVRERLEEDELLPVMSDIDGVVCGDDRFTARVIEASPKLKVLSKCGTGIDSLDKEACAANGVVIRNTPNAFSEAVADTVAGYMLCFCRKLPWMDKSMKNGIWDKIPGTTLAENTLGVIGTGDVGKAVVRRAKGFSMTLLGNDIKEMPSDFIETTGVTMLDKFELLSRADFVSMNCDLNPTSHHLMSDAEFEAMKPSAVLINTGRGPTVDEQALIRALKTGQIAGAALDVFEHEPLPQDSPLRFMDNVMLAAHNANSSPRLWENVHRSTLNNLLDELKKRA